MAKKTNKFEREAQAYRVSDELGITYQLAKELLILAGGDEEIVINCSDDSECLSECKAKIIDARMSKQGK